MNEVLAQEDLSFDSQDQAGGSTPVVAAHLRQRPEEALQSPSASQPSQIDEFQAQGEMPVLKNPSGQ